MSQNYETCYSILSNIRAYEQKCYNSFDYFIYFLSPPNTYLSPSATQLSLSLLFGLHLSVAPYFFLTFIFFISHSLLLSLHFGIIVYVPLSLSLSLLLFFFFLPPPAPCSCHSLFPFSSSFFSSIFTVASGSFFFFSCHYLSLFLFLS